jgi:hypothetical protein
MLVGVLFLAGCYQPSILNGGYTCSPTDQPPCPDGYYCVNGVCVDSPGYTYSGDTDMGPGDGDDMATTGGGDDDMATSGGDGDDMARPQPKDMAHAPVDMAKEPPVDMAHAPVDMAHGVVDMATGGECLHAGSPCTAGVTNCCGVCSSGLCIGG